MNEVRLIDANDLEIELTMQKAHLMDKSKHTTIESDRMMYMNTATGLIHAINILHNAPTIEPSLNLDNITDEEIEKFKLIWQRANSKGLLAINEERPQGEWIYNQYDANPKIGNWHCSICHTICYEMKLAHDNFNYCPNCGAYMKGGAE